MVVGTIVVVLIAIVKIWCCTRSSLSFRRIAITTIDAWRIDALELVGLICIVVEIFDDWPVSDAKKIEDLVLLH